MQQKEVKTSRGVIKYVDSEKGNKIVVFIHGGFGDVQPASRLLGHLGNDYRVIAPILPGHGLFDLTDTDTYDHIVETISEFLTKLEIENFVLFGHSLGGRLAMDLLKHKSSKAGFAMSVSPLLAPIDQSLFATTAHL